MLTNIMINRLYSIGSTSQLRSIRLMFILEILLGLKSKQGDVTCAFLHADLEPGENVYVDMPLGFAQYSNDGTKKYLKL